MLAPIRRGVARSGTRNRRLPMLRSLFVVVFGTVLVGCAPQPPGGGGGERAPAAAQTGSKSINLGVRYEFANGQSKALNNSSSDIQKRFFNASLALMDGRGELHPYL